MLKDQQLYEKEINNLRDELEETNVANEEIVDNNQKYEEELERMIESNKEQEERQRIKENRMNREINQSKRRLA